MDNMYSNPYTSSYAPSTFPQQGQQDQQGLGPVFQNTSAQQQFLANQLRDSNQMAQYHGYGGGGGGFNPASLANMLKSKSAPKLDFSPNTPVQNVSPELDPSAYGTDVSGMGDWLSNLGVDFASMGSELAPAILAA